MYKSFFGLEKNPFSITPDPNFLYLTSRHREALAGLLFAVTCRKGFLVLTGDAGTGKTTLLRTILQRVPPERAVFSFVVHPTLSPAEFLEYMLLDFGFKDIPASKAQRLVLFQQFLVHSHQEGRVPVLVVDEAQKLSPELLEEIRLLTNAETSEQKLLQIVLAGQNELSDVLAREDMRQLRQRIAVRLTIGALFGQEVLHYIQTRWKRAAKSAEFPFTAGAVEAIARCSRGIPRVINAICDTALVNAFAAEQRTIDAAQIGIAAQDLQLRSPAVDSLGSTSDLPIISAAGQSQESLKFITDQRPLALPELKRYAPEPEQLGGIMRWMTRLGLGKA